MPIFSVEIGPASETRTPHLARRTASRSAGERQLQAFPFGHRSNPFSNGFAGNGRQIDDSSWLTGRCISRLSVRIRLAPPHSLACFHTFWRSDEIGAWGAVHARPWTRRMPAAAAERKNRAKFSVHDFGGSICEPANILREPRTHPARARKGSSAGVSYRTSRARSCALQSEGSSILWVIATVVRSAGWRPSAIALTILGARNASRITRRT